MEKIKKKRTQFAHALEKTLEVIRDESPISVTRIANITDTDWRAINRALDFLLEVQDEFAAREVKVIEGRWGKVIWIRDRVDKMKLPEDIREWYIEKRFFGEREIPEGKKDAIGAVSESAERTSMEEVIRRVFKALQVEDDLTLTEIASRTGTNRKTVSKALEIILGIQDNVAEGLITKKRMAVWRKRPALHELDKTTIKLLLQKRYFPDETREISEEQERALLQAAW